MALTTMAADNDKLHIVMFPWLAFGHLMPYLELAKLIARKGHRVSFVSTPRNIDRLPKNAAPLIHFVKLPLPHVPNLPENAEATIDVPYDMVQYLKKAFDGLQEPMTQFLQASDPDWVLHDFAPYWVGPIAAKLDVSCAFFTISIASSVSFFFGPIEDDRTEPRHFTVTPKWFPFPSNVAFRYFEILKIFDSVEVNDSGISDLDRFRESLKHCHVLALRSCADFQPEWLQLLEEIHRKPVIPVGQLPSTEYDSGGREDAIAWEAIKEWLDKQERGSVVYVAFGSEAKTSQQELTEIALGLELAGLPFFWVLRTRRGSADTHFIELPDGFEKRISKAGRGLVCTTWVPQLKILGHDSVGGFLSHSGWSSVVEALQFERPLILLTFLAEQGLNARVLEDKNIGYAIPRNEQDGSFTRDSVAQSLRLVMVEEEGKIYRDKAKEMRGLFGDRDRQDRYVDNLLLYLSTHKHLHRLASQ
ncbi:hypothetical protein L1049_026677 [Liquidambar formosana]|uniref:Uncharacterized protein n=1 Tax=Liquidambar formosana TaxID=63359 RepID=A0AAP0NE52_LIQFO